MANYSFQKGYGQIPADDQTKVREQIMKFLGITVKSQWFKRLYGDIEPRISEVAGIEKIFAKRGIPAHKVWGKPKRLRPRKVLIDK